MTDDPFPEAPTYDELEEMYTPLDEFDDLTEFADANEEWYNEAPFVAARLMVRVAREHDEFRAALLEDDDFGVAHEMGAYDEEAYRKLNSMSLSAFQGGTAENMARHVLGDDDAD